MMIDGIQNWPTWPIDQICTISEANGSSTKIEKDGGCDDLRSVRYRLVLGTEGIPVDGLNHPQSLGKSEGEIDLLARTGSAAKPQ